jgi:hypothetical protein
VVRLRGGGWAGLAVQEVESLPSNCKFSPQNKEKKGRGRGKRRGREKEGEGERERKRERGVGLSRRWIGPVPSKG